MLNILHLHGPNLNLPNLLICAKKLRVLKQESGVKMRILYLGPHSSLIEYLESQGNIVIHHQEKITKEVVGELRPDFLVSYNYRFILKRDVLDLFLPNRAVNLHISYLPWNRGADPNLWSFLEDTPKGVTIHYMDEGLDTGDIIVQKEVIFQESDTLRSAYNRLQEEIQDLFKKNWPDISVGTCSRKKQSDSGSFHRAKDKDALFSLFKDGWDTPISHVLYIRPFPQVIRIEPAASCNFNCIHCPTGLGMSPTGVMSAEIFDKICSELETVVARQNHLLKTVVLYHGGEPLLNKHFFDMVRRVKKLAKSVKTVTNGSRLDDRAIEEAIDSGLDLIEISLDGVSAEENDTIRLNRVGASFETISKKVIALIQRRNQRGSLTPKVLISNTQIPETVEQVLNQPEPPQYMLDAFTTVLNDIEFNCNWAAVWPGMPIKISGRPDHNFCDHVVNTMTIRSNGDIVVCCYDLVNKMPIGNIANQTLEEIWNNKRYQNVRRAINSYSPPGLCVGCPVLYKFAPITKGDILHKK